MSEFYLGIFLFVWIAVPARGPLSVKGLCITYDVELIAQCHV